MCNLDISKLFAIFHGASIAVIGGYDRDVNIPELEKEYDFLFRINNHCVRQGGRVDALFHAAAPDSPINEVRHLIKDLFFLAAPGYASCVNDFHLEAAKYWIPTFTYQDKPLPEQAWYVSLCVRLRRYEAYPLTGIVATWFALQNLNPSKVHLCGMNLYLGSLPTPGMREHNLPGHARFLATIYKEDPRLNYSDCLKDSIKELVDED